MKAWFISVLLVLLAGISIIVLVACNSSPQSTETMGTVSVGQTANAKSMDEVGSYVKLEPKVDQEAIAAREAKATQEEKKAREARQAEEAKANKEAEKHKGRQIDKNKPMIALTFDDGPSLITPRILDILKKYNAKATFFMLGNRTGTYSDTVKRIFDEGNEIGSHSFSHPQLSKLSPEEVCAQFNDTDNLISEIVPFKPQLARPPYGEVTQPLKDNVKKSFILWSVDSLDWKTRNCDSTVNAILSTAGDGDIVLMHDLYDTTADACEVFIPKLIEQGYQLVTVSELLEAKGLDQAPGSVHFSA